MGVTSTDHRALLAARRLALRDLCVVDRFVVLRPRLERVLGSSEAPLLHRVDGDDGQAGRARSLGDKRRTPTIAHAERHQALRRPSLSVLGTIRPWPSGHGRLGASIWRGAMYPRRIPSPVLEARDIKPDCPRPRISRRNT